MQRVKWSDLQYVLEVAQQGSIAAAARSLGVNQSTVLRRINAFEERQGFKLFVRRTSGYKLTAEGQNVLATAMAIDTTVRAMEMRLSGEEVALEGTLISKHSAPATLACKSLYHSPIKCLTSTS